MKEALALCLFTSTLVLGAPAAYAKPHGAHKKTSALSATKAAPALSLSQAEAAPKHAKSSYWLAADPHVPLATVEGKAIRSVGKRGKECGAASRWALPKSRWNAVDAFGRPTGVFEVASSETFDVTGCNEVSFSPRSGKPGVGLFVSGDSPYSPGESASYSASALEKKRFEHFLGAMEGSWVNQRPLGKSVPWGKRTLFFQFPPPKDASLDGRVDGAGKPIEQPKHWAVAGGPLLVVAYLGDKGHWKAASVKSPLGLADSYTPLAVFDMNGDGIPEIVVRVVDGASFADKVLALDTATMTWEAVAESPGGAAL
jgi:hypothetical protein